MTPTLLGLLAGAGLPTQTAVNARLRRALGSPFLATLATFTIGAVLMWALVLTVHGTGFLPRDRADRRGPWWMWLGGVLGPTIVTLKAALVPVLGTGMTVALSLAGTAATSVLIDRLGAFGQPKRPVRAAQVLGVVVLVVGAGVVRLTS